MPVTAPLTRETSRPVTLPDAERLARLRLARSTNVGPRTYSHLLHRFGSAIRALDALPSLAAAGGRAGYQEYSRGDAEAEIAAAERAGATMVLVGEPDYPRHLGQIDFPPPVLWIAGDLTILQRPAVAVVGARNASALGLRTARNLARELGQSGQVIISGLARGIDAAAHETALNTGTVAVMAGGIDWIYPLEHGPLAARIRETGALVSECPIGMEPTSRHFPRRNRLISGLAQGVVLIEAAIRSGSLITARYSLEQGREAMACPGAPEDPRSGGCNQLIRDGAALIRNAGDVLEALSGPRRLDLAEPGREFLFDDDPFGDDYPGVDFEGSDDTGAGDFEDDDRMDAALADQILRLLGPQPVDSDELARQCGAAPAEFSLAILELDLAGRIDLLPGGQISLSSPA